MAKRRKRPVPSKKRLREIADRLWGRAVLEDWAGKCAVCGKEASHSHHLVPRQHSQTRYDLRNGIALCVWDHIWNPNTSPHENAAGWLHWLSANHCETYQWYIENQRPELKGVVNEWWYCGHIWDLMHFLNTEDTQKIVGIRFAAWLEDNYV